MSNDLISRKAVLNILYECHIDNADKRVFERINKLSAYDIDKVVEQLEEMRDAECDAACDRRNNNYEQSNGFVKAIRCAIEIVRGGIDDN